MIKINEKIVSQILKCISCEYQEDAYEPKLFGCGSSHCFNEKLFIEIKEGNNMENEKEINQLDLIKEAVFDWVKNHKRDIIVATGSAIITSYICSRYGFKNDKNWIGITFNGEENTKKNISGYVSSSFKNYSIKELGKFGKELMKEFPSIINQSSTINSVGVNYNIYKK